MQGLFVGATALILVVGSMCALGAPSPPASGTTLTSVSVPPALHFSWRYFCERQPALVCNLQPTLSNVISGVVHFKPVFQDHGPGYFPFGRCRVRVSAALSGLSPGKHGWHIHTYGDTRTPSGASTGGHFTNPWGGSVPHALPRKRPRHWGDFGNLDASMDGTAEAKFVDSQIRIGGIIGRGMIVHAGEDLGEEFQPSGAFGPRQAMCVIGLANPDV